MGPVSAKSYAGRALVQSRTRPAERARQEIDYGRRAKGYIFGAFCPATGEAFTHPYPGRGGAHWVDFLGQVESSGQPGRPGPDDQYVRGGFHAAFSLTRLRNTSSRSGSRVRTSTIEKPSRWTAASTSPALHLSLR